MFCPRCGQQAADEIRYCPKCGLALTPHAALLTVDHSAAAAPAVSQPPAPTPKRINTRRAAKLLFFSVALFPVFLIMSLVFDEPAPLLVPLMMFIAGLAWLIYTRLFGDDLAQPAPPAARRDLNAGAGRPALSPPQSYPPSLFDQQGVNTAEISQPPSITENTTTLLEKDV